MKRLLLFGLLPGCFTPRSYDDFEQLPPCNPDEPNTICTIAGQPGGSTGLSGNGGLAIEAELYWPLDSRVAPDGSVWLIDFNNYMIRSIDERGIINAVVGCGDIGDSPVSDHLTEVPAIAAFMNHTTSIYFDHDYLYLAGWHQSRINRVRLADMVLETFAGLGTRTKGDGGSASAASLDLPSSIAVSPDDKLTFTDQANQVIRQIDSNGVIHTIAGSCIIDDEDTCTSSGTTPVPCEGSNKLTCGDPTTCRGHAGYTSCLPAFAGDGGPATAARFALPSGALASPSGGIAYDHAGNLWIADTGNHRIRKIDTNGIITTVAGTGRNGFSGDGPGTSIELNGPVDIVVGDDDTIYFTDVMNNCVRKIDAVGMVTTVVGACNADPAAREFSGDGGAPLVAKLNRPYGIDLYGSKLYVSDTYNNRLRVVNLEQ